MAMLARLGVVLGLDTAEFSRGLEQADKKLEAFGKKLPGIAMAGAAAFTALTYKALAYADEISDVAKANEVATETIMALSEGLAQNGGEAANAGKMMSSFTAKIDDAAQGSKEAQEAFARVGVSLKDLGSKDITQLFDQTLEKLASMDDPISRNAAAMTLFGKAAKGVDFKGLAEGSAEARHEFQEYAKAVNQAAELHDKLDAKANKTIVMFTKEFLPTLNTIFDAFNQTGSAMQTVMENAGAFFKYLVIGFNQVVSGVKLLAHDIGAVVDVVTLKKNYKEAYQESVDFANRLDKLDLQFRKDIMNPQQVEGKATPFAGRKVTPYVDKAEASKLKKEQEAVQLAAQLSVLYEKHSQFTLEQLKRKADLINLTEKERQVEEAVLSIRDDSRRQIEDIDKKKTEASIHGQTALVAEYEKQKQLIIERSRFFEEATRREILAQQEVQNSFEFGWNRAFRQFNENAQNYALQGTAYFDSMTNSMMRGIDQFVQTGKLSFKDFTASVLQDLLRIALRMQAMRLMSAAYNLFGGMFSAGTSLASPTTSAAAGTYNLGGASSASAYGGGLKAFASGGNPPVGVPSLVGENGPELFIPRGAGTIIPNQRLSGAMGGSTNITNNYINAIDTKSFEDRLLGSSNAIWAANQYANKSLQVSGSRT